jgi:hypothetical protein
MKREDREKVRWLLEGLMAEHRAACPHFDDNFPDDCPTVKSYDEALKLVEKG